MTDDNDTLNTARVLAELGEKASNPTIIEIDTDTLADPTLPAKIPLLWDRNLQSPIRISDALNDYRTSPVRRRGNATVDTLESFCDLVNRHKTHHSVVFANLDWRSPSMTAVIDYHPVRAADGDPVGQEADWLEHRIKYDFPMSSEWKAWSELNGKLMTQSDFALMIEDRVAELVAPDKDEEEVLGRLLMTTVASPAQIMALSRGLQVHVAGVVKSARVVQSGESEIVFSEEHQDSAGKPIKVPGAFVINIPTFVGGENVRMPVRLRYRTAGGGINWFYQMYRPETVIAEQLFEDRQTVEQATALPFYEGKPESR